MGSLEKRVLKYVENNIGKLKKYAGEDVDWGEFRVSTKKHLILYDTTGFEDFVRVEGQEGVLFTVREYGNVEVDNIIGTWFFFQGNYYKDLMDEVVRYT